MSIKKTTWFTTLQNTKKYATFIFTVCRDNYTWTWCITLNMHRRPSFLPGKSRTVHFGNHHSKYIIFYPEIHLMWLPQKDKSSFYYLSSTACCEYPSKPTQLSFIVYTINGTIPPCIQSWPLAIHLSVSFQSFIGSWQRNYISYDSVCKKKTGIHTNEISWRVYSHYIKIYFRINPSPAP